MMMVGDDFQSLQVALCNTSSCKTAKPHYYLPLQSVLHHMNLQYPLGLHLEPTENILNSTGNEPVPAVPSTGKLHLYNHSTAL